MSIIVTFALAFLFSILGSIPPGTINLTIIQLGLERKINIAFRLAVAAALIEYPYAWIAITFKTWILSSPVVLDNMKLITAVVMVLLGVLNILSSGNPSPVLQRFQSSGFRRGIMLGILNPLAMPYWLGITAYLEAQHWIDISTNARLHAYLAGISSGAFAILIMFAFLARKIVTISSYGTRLKKAPGFILLGLGLYAFARYLL